ncbi:MAG TPA: fibronectin type III domain-containing protein, partial [Candidatus Dojkabacteria bacterium]|nr:fibronectin type III domain-containing protein [Candidatus Dojkabacteria bacterium]
MKVATVPTKRRKDLIIIAILLIGLPILVFASYQVYQFFIRASVEAKPQNVVLSNLTTSSVTVSWTTEVSATGSVVPVSNGQEMSPVLDERGTGKTKTHYVELMNLEPNTDYGFFIISDSEKYDSSNGKSFRFKTAPITAQAPTPNPIHGTVSGASGEDIVVYAMLKDKSAYPVSAIMPRGGNWIMDLSALRTVNGNSLVSVGPSTNFVLVAVSGLQEGAILEGTFSELFDSNGKLKDVNALNIIENTSLYLPFPEASFLGSAPEEPIEEEVVVPEQESGLLQESGFLQESGLLEEEDSERDYQRVQDVEWVDILTSGSTVNSPTGEESVRIVNLTDTGFSVMWISQEREEGYIKYGTSSTSLTSEAADERDGVSSKGEYYVHLVSTARLLPETKYSFEIVSGTDTYDNNGNKYSVTTGPTLSSPPPFDSASGDIEGLPEHREAVVVAYVEDGDGVGTEGRSSEMATIVDDNARWILSIADVRNSDRTSYFEYTSGDILKLDVVTTFPTDPHEEGIQGVGGRDIRIVVKESQTSAKGK